MYRNYTLYVIGEPITRVPIVAKKLLDFYKLYKLVVAKGGVVNVIEKKLWQKIITELCLPRKATSAAFTLCDQ